MATQEFQFKFMLLTITATIDDINLSVKQGVRSWKAELSKIKHLYVLTHPGAGRECIISYETANGKKKNIRCTANFGEQKFDELVETLVKMRPGIDIRQMPAKEAYKLMHAVNVVRLAPVISFAVVAIVVSVIFMPGLVHGFDFGKAKLDAERCLAACPVSSRNVTLVNGYLNVEQYVEETTTTTNRGSTSTNVRYFIPYVSENWQKGDPVFMVVETPQISEQELDTLVEQEELPCVLRNVLWEGLGGDTKKFFETEFGLKLAPEVRLFEYGADPRLELIITLIIIGAALLITIISTMIIVIKQKKA